MGTPTNVDLSFPNRETHLERKNRYLIGDLLRKNVRTDPDAVALVGEGDQSATYAELNDRVNALANGLLEHGIDYGSRLAILSENRPEFVEVLYSGAKLGALVCPLNWRLAKEELLHTMEIADVDVVVVSNAHADKSEWVREADVDPLQIHIGGGADVTSYEAVVEGSPTGEPTPAQQPTPDDGVTIFNTSGTTGLPKGAVVSHRTIFAHVLSGWKYCMNLGPDYAAWTPMFHIAGTEPLFVVGLEGGTFYTIDGHKPELILQRAAESEQGWLSLMPNSVEPVKELIEQEGYVTSDWDGITHVGSQADLWGASQIRELTELFDADFVNTFGATEIGAGALSANLIPKKSLPSKGDLSKEEGPLCDVKLVDEDWNEVKRGEEGELAVRGPVVFNGYIANQEANGTDFHEGYFRTGDIFVQNDDGMYDFVDRRKYLIKSGGENIYPAEIERVIMDQLEVEETIVVKVADDVWGEVPKAYVALTPDADMDRADVLARLEDQIARYKFPHYVEFVEQDDFPRSVSGKIVRGQVEEWAVSESERVRNP
jgi:acyl-CoA synthetase (AMP-forming)/AMP-acid ligase II